MDSPSLNRRGFLIGGLAGALTMTAAGTTGLRLFDSSRASAGTGFVVDVTGDYEFTDSATGCRVSVQVRNGIRRIRANGLPNHSHGSFPNASVSPQSYDFSLPTAPSRGGGTALTIPQPFGIAVNGVLFDPLAAEWWNNDPAWHYNALGGGVPLFLDTNNAHVQPTGAYHYHGIPTGLRESMPTTRHSPLIGWAGDGFPVYLNRGYRKPRKKSSGLTRLTSSYRLRSGTRSGGPGGRYDGQFLSDYQYVAKSGDLDENNGRFQVTPEYPGGTYCYILTGSFPVIPLRLEGPLADSFVRRPGAGAPPR